jgi:hypothetical protein
MTPLFKACGLVKVGIIAGPLLGADNKLKMKTIPGKVVHNNKLDDVAFAITGGAIKAQGTFLLFLHYKSCSN